MKTDAQPKKNSILKSLEHQIRFEADRQKATEAAIKKGHSFFTEFNSTRLELAFSSFSEEMKHALFEVMFFLHINDPFFSTHKYNAFRKERVKGVYTDVPYETETSLYVKESPTGVVGIEKLSPVFAKEFKIYVEKELGPFEIKKNPQSAIYSVSSLGSIGTIGHKAYKSDLDLQVQYELEPFLIQEQYCTDKHLHAFLVKLSKYFGKLYIYKNKIKVTEGQKQEILQKAAKVGKNMAKKRWPLLYAHFIEKTINLEKLLVSDRYVVSKKQAKATANEVVDVYQLYCKLFRKKERARNEKLLRKKINAIQDYVMRKFPKAETYLFAYSNEDYRKGNHGTTLESKESSGSAYELILNYEVLMPGIQYTPVVPTHFLMDETTNTDKASYEQLVRYFQFNLFNIDPSIRENLVDLGATPKMTQQYLTEHSGAVYWESFKASSGNLPKALLNLLRIEMIFDRRFSSTIIEIIKKPELLDRYLSPEYPKLIDNSDQQPAPDEKSQDSLPIQKLAELEQQFPLLKSDPWWIKYKALKIGFSAEFSNITESDELKLLSRIIDICFALHVRLSDVFVLPKGKSEFKTHRENVLYAFLSIAFPEGSSHHLFLCNIFNGDLKNMALFEAGMKQLFRNSLARVLSIVNRLEQTMASKTNRDEYRIWYHYYSRNFDPPLNMVQKNILSQLKNARQRLLIEYKEEKWSFRSIQQRDSQNQLPEGVSRQLSHLPDDVELIQHDSFLHGLTNCILNGYYGITHKGTLKESRTQIEFVASKINLGSMASNKWAIVRPSDIDNIAQSIDEAFAYQEYDYRDCLKSQNEIVDVYFFLNLLKFGQLSVVYRNNLRQWFVDDFYSPKIEQKASLYYSNYVELLTSTELHRMIASFLKNRRFKLTEQNLQHLSCWLNPNSAQTKHSANQQKQKEQAINGKFKAIISAVHQYKETASE